MTAPAAPARQPIVNGWQLAVKYTVASQPAANVLGLHCPNGLDDATAALIHTAWAKAMRPVLTTNVVFTGATMRNCWGNAVVYELPAPTGLPAAGAHGVAVAALSAILKWSTATGGRSGKGKTYLPGLGVNQVDTNGRSISASAKAAFATAMTTYLGDPVFGGTNAIRPAVLSFKNGAAYPIVAGALSDQVGVQGGRRF